MADISTRRLRDLSSRFPALWEDFGDIVSSFPGIPSGLSLSEDEKHVYVEAAVPGVNPEDVDITYDNDELWIKAAAEVEEEEKNKKYYRKASKTFSYRITLPADINPDTKPEAEYKNGVMMIRFEKSPKTQPKRIQVRGVKERAEEKKKRNTKE